MSKYNVLIFDADGTIFDFDKSEWFALDKSFEKFNLTFNHSLHLKYYKKINMEIWSEFERGSISSGELKKERFKRYNDEFNFNIDPELFSDSYLSYLSEAAFLLDGAEELLNKTFNKYKLILLTNGLTKVQKKRFKITNMKKYFKEIIISEEVGYKKPQKEIFELALKNIAHYNKKDVLMIGDNLSSDILGGINYGIDTCWYNPQNKNGNKEIIPTYIAANFSEILNII